MNDWPALKEPVAWGGAAPWGGLTRWRCYMAPGLISSYFTTSARSGPGGSGGARRWTWYMHTVTGSD